MASFLSSGDERLVVHSDLLLPVWSVRGLQLFKFFIIPGDLLLPV